MKEKYKNIIDEVMDEINISLEDPRGIVTHQRRIAFSLSVGTVTLLEYYLDKKQILKPGGKINHLWLKKKKENANKLISNQTITPIQDNKDINEFLDLAYNIEKDRNELAYGNKASEKRLKEKIETFLKLKEHIENA